MILRHHAHDAPVFATILQRLLYRMAHPDSRTRLHSAASQMLIDAAHIEHTSNGWVIRQWHLSLRRNKDHLWNRMIEVLRYRQSLHIANPATTTRMHGIANLILTL